MKVKSSSRINRRYLLLEAENKEVVEKTILEYIGVLGWAKAAPVFVDSPEGIVLAVERKSVSDIRASFELSKRKIKVIKVSGTIKGLE